MEKLEFPQVGEQMYHEKLENGLNVFVFPKPDHQKGYAFFATNYGGMDMRFCLDGTWHDTPAGVAHFLEHKMFDTKEGNALQELAANGASPNAFTSNAMTAYYFESTEKFEENLKILLSFVSVPWFTQESVDKEQGIIGQEIRMYEDDPGWEVYLGLVQSLYHHHPVRENVAGSVESISHITAETLYACHKAFYDPANMVLCVAGPVEAVCAAARAILPKTPGPIAEKDYGGPEPEGAVRPRTEKKMAVSTPLFQLGWKGDAPRRGEAGLRQELVGELAMEALLGTSSPLYARMYREAVSRAVAEEAGRIAREGIDPALWARIKKGIYGGKVRSLNSFENLCVGQAGAFFEGTDYLRFAPLLSSVEREEAEALLARWVIPARAALSVVSPKEAQA